MRKNMEGKGNSSTFLNFTSGDEISGQRALNMLQQSTASEPNTAEVVVANPGGRVLHHQASFNEVYQLDRPTNACGWSRVSNYMKSKCSCGTADIWNFTKKRLPVLEWVPKYDIKANAIPDLLGGVTVGIMQIPQGMAYALLADMPPVMGLYVSFFSLLVYIIFGTSRHLSLGTFAIVSLMTSNVVNNYVASHYPSDFSAANSTSNVTVDIDQVKIQVAIVTAFTVGLLQIGMAIVQLGSLSVYLSEMLVSGFTTGAAVLVFASQIKYVLGLSVPYFSGPLGIVYTFIAIFSNIKHTNIVTLALSACVIVSLLVVNDCINLRYRSKMIMPVPVELLVIVASTLASYYLDLHDEYDVEIVGYIPIGIPPPKVPQFSMMNDIVTSCVAIAIVSYCIPISIGKIYGKKHGYDVDPNQEMLTYGISNLVGGFFNCFPCCGSLSRSSVQEGSGAKTQVASLVSCTLILIVLLLIAPLFQPVPNCVLAGIIMVALRGMIRQYNDLFNVWKFSKTEAAIWLVTFLSVVILDVDYGLIVAVSFLLILLLYKIQRPYTTLLGNVPTTEAYLDVHKYKVPKEVNGLKIVHFGGPLYFANREYFRRIIYKLVFNPRQEMERRRKKEKKSSKDDVNSNSVGIDMEARAERQRNSVSFSTSPDAHSENAESGSISESLADSVTAIILDCECISFVDSSAISVLSQLINEYKEFGVTIYLSNCKDNVLLKLEKSEIYSQLERSIFPTVHHAVLNIVENTSQLSICSPSAATQTCSQQCEMQS